MSPGKPGINNTAYLFGALAFAFVFWITVRGDLPKWLGLLGLASNTQGGAAPLSPMEAPGAAGLPSLPGLAIAPALAGVDPTLARAGTGAGLY